MGYCTSYELKIKGITSQEEYDAVAKKLKELGVLNYALEEDIFDGRFFTQYFGFYDLVKWYEHDEDMIELSKAFPNFTFCLHGEGNESCDMWDTYYYRGELEHCPVEVRYRKPEKIKWKD